MILRDLSDVFFCLCAETSDELEEGTLPSGFEMRTVSTFSSRFELAGGGCLQSRCAGEDAGGGGGDDCTPPTIVDVGVVELDR